MLVYATDCISLFGGVVCLSLANQYSIILSYSLSMLELLVIFQLQVDTKTSIVSDTVVSVPKWLSHADVLDLVKKAVAAIQWAWAILNIINMDVVNPPKFVAPAPVVVVEQEARKHSSFALRREESRSGAKYNAQRSERKFGAAPREESAPREEGRGGFVPREGWFRDRPSGGGYKGKGKPAGGWFRGKSSRPPHAGRWR